MKYLLAQIAFAIAVFIALATTSCGGSLNGADTSINDNSLDKKAALEHLNAKKEGIQQDEYYIYSIKCWKSAMEDIAAEDATSEAKNQLEEFCPTADTSSSNTQIQTQRVEIFTCALVSVSKEDLDCK
jgi:hypothetical protein